MADQDDSNEASDQPNLNTTMTLSTPDIVSSCDPSTSALDSFGILSQEAMADFSFNPNSANKIENKLERLPTKRSKDKTFNACKVPRFASTMNSTVVLSKEIDHQPASSNCEVQAIKLPLEASITQEEDIKQTPSHFLMSPVPCHSTPLADLSGCLEMVAPLVDGIEHAEPMIGQYDVDQGVGKNSNNFLEADAEIPISNSKVQALELIDGNIKIAAKPTLKPKPSLKAKQSVSQSRVSKPKLPSGPKQPLVKTLLSQNPRSIPKEMLLIRKSTVDSGTTKPKLPILKVAPSKPQMSISKPPIKQVAPISVHKSSVAPVHAVGRLASTKSTLKVQRSESNLSTSSTKSNISSKSNTSGSSTKNRPSNLPKSGSILSIKKTESKLIGGRTQETSNIQKSSSSILSSSGRLSIEKNSSKNLSENRSSSKILQKSVSNLSAGRPTTTSLSKTSISRTGMKSDENTRVKLSSNNLPKSNVKPSSKSLENASKSSLSTTETVSATGARSKYPGSNLSRKTTTNGLRSTITSRQSKDPVKSPNLTLKTNTNSTTGNGQSGLTSSNSFIATDVTAKPSNLPRSLSNISSGVKQTSLTPSYTSSARTLSDVNSFQPGKINPAGRIAPRVTPVRGIQRVPSSHLLTPRGSQPDLVKASTPRSDLHNEVTKLQYCLAAKIEEIDHVKLAITDNNVAFNALAIVAKNLLDETEQAQSLKYNLEAYKSRNQSLQLEMENSKQKHKLAEEDFNKLLLQLGRDIETMCRKHEEEKDTVKEAHRCQVDAQKLDLQEEMRKRKHRSEKDLDLLVEKHKTEILRLGNANVISLNKEKALFQDKEREQLKSYEVEKEKLEQKIEQLESKVSALVVNLMNGPDHRDGAMAEMQKEIDSLRSVVDMRNADIKYVKEENQRLCQKFSTFKEMKEKVRNLSSQVEDMKELLAIKRSNERKLDIELQQLQESMHKTSREKRRLSIEKEQLEWRMKQGMPMQSCLVEETQSHSFSGETQHSRRNFKTFHFRSPSLNNTEPLPLHSHPLDYSPPPISSTPSASVVDYRTRRASVSYQLDLSDCLTPDSARTVGRRQRRLDTGLGDRQ